MFEFFVTTYGTQLLGLILCAIFGTLGYVVKQIAKTYLDNETKADCWSDGTLLNS